MKPAVSVEHLSKTYRVYPRPWNRLLEPVLRRRLHQPFEALRDVSFELPRGEALGVVGENGAGKSTLLKILTGITAPTSGTYSVAGNVAAILELGSGFHPEFTGRQNIVLNAAMLGLGEEQIAERTPEIIAFSELGTFIDQPVKCYSTGMVMRLAFAVAVQVEPDVLIIDEALSVGDGYFQKKCLDQLRRYKENGGTLLFCSHAMYYVSAFCGSALWIRQGQVEALGPVDEVIRAYEGFLDAKATTALPAIPAASGETSRGAPARLESVRVAHPAREDEDRGDDATPEPLSLAPGDALEVEVAWSAEDHERPLHLGICLNRGSDGIEVCAFGTHRDGRAPFRGRTRYRVRLRIPKLELVKGTFTLYVYLLDEVGLHVYDQRILPDAFVVESTEYHFGLVTMDHRWEDGTEDQRHEDLREKVMA